MLPECHHVICTGCLWDILDGNKLDCPVCKLEGHSHRPPPPPYTEDESVVSEKATLNAHRKRAIKDALDIDKYCDDLSEFMTMQNKKYTTVSETLEKVRREVNAHLDQLQGELRERLDMEEKKMAIHQAEITSMTLARDETVTRIDKLLNKNSACEIALAAEELGIDVPENSVRLHYNGNYPEVVNYDTVMQSVQELVTYRETIRKSSYYTIDATKAGNNDSKSKAGVKYHTKSEDVSIESDSATESHGSATIELPKYRFGTVLALFSASRVAGSAVPAAGLGSNPDKYDIPVVVKSKKQLSLCGAFEGFKGKRNVNKAT